MRRLVCYAHFDDKGRVRPFVLHALQVMSKLCAELVFVSNSPVPDKERQLLSKLCLRQIVNSNTGYDFYMWKLGLESVDLSLYDEVVLMNSSVFGPLFDMKEEFLQMEQLPCDFWGITECFQMQPHIQTYFLVFKKKVINSEVFSAFWHGILPYTNKLQVIQSYEVGLTQWLVESGFQPGVLCSFDQIGERCAAAGKRLRRKDNASVKFAAELLDAGSPFLKRDAVRNCKVAMDRVLPFVYKMEYPAALIDEEHESVDHNCPNCGSAGRLWRKGVRNYISLHDTERYDYLRCTSKKCGVVWLKNAVKDVRSIAVPVASQTKRAFETVESVGIMERPNILLVTDVDVSIQAPLDTDWLGFKYAKVTNSGELQPVSCFVPKGEADIVVILNALELVDDPGQLLKEAYHALKPGGLLYVETLNADSVIGSIFQGYWNCLRAPYVRFLFSAPALRTLIVASGFEHARITSRFSLTRQSFVASLEALRNKRISQTRQQTIKPLLKTGFVNSSDLFDKLTPAWGDTWYISAYKKKNA